MTRRPTYSWCLQISVPDIDASIDLHDIVMTDCTRNASLTLMVVFEYITTKRELLSLNTIHKHDGYGACFPEGLDCDQASAVDISRYQTVIIRCWNPGWGWRLKDPRQQSTKVGKHKNTLSELSKT